jgi:uncharacterized protein (TIGR03663 family)
MNWRFALVLLVIVVGALGLRLPQLNLRPMHADEAVHAHKFRDLWEKGNYTYDPDEFHGPTLPYTTLVAARLLPGSDYNQFDASSFRIVPVFFGIGAILLFWLLADGLGRAAALCAAAFAAVSPAMVYYSRYYIHEMLLVFFTLLVLGAGWRYVKSGRLGWCLLAGAGLGLMHATKETFVLALGALGGAVVMTWLWTRWVDGENIAVRLAPHWKNLLAGLAVAGVVSVVFFTSFFSNPGGPLDSIRTYEPWLNRAGGDSPHIHPWHFYLERLAWFQRGNGPVWTEALILGLAMIGAAAVLWRRSGGQGDPRLLRVVAFYTILLTLGYTMISYKTPWCLLGFWVGMILLAGVGAMTLVRGARWPVLQAAVAMLLAMGAAHLGWQAWRASIEFSASRVNPYVYAHTSPDLHKLIYRLHELANAHPEKHDLLVKVMVAGGDYWPLPWYLRQFPRVGWWDRVTVDPLAPVMIVSSTFEAAFDELPEKSHLMPGYFQLRPGVFLELYVELDLWKRFLETRPRPMQDDDDDE